MIYEIINPSDPVVFETDDFECAAVATLLVGEGRCAAKPQEDGGEEVPLFLFGGHDEWSQARFGCSFSNLLDRVTETKARDLVFALRSFVIGHAEDITAYRRGLELIDDPAKRDVWREEWKEARRSSLNDICGRAWQIADWAEKKFVKESQP